MPQTLTTIRISDTANLTQWRTRMADDFALVYGYQETISGSPNPETKAQFATRKLAEYVRDVHKQAKVTRDAGGAADTARSAADVENTEVLAT